MRLTPALVGFGASQTATTVWLFPVWWYGPATRDLCRSLRRAFMADRRALQVRLLLRHQLSPLFGGDGSWEMHVISVFIRIPLTLAVLLWTVALGCGLVLVLLLWLAAPVAVLGSVLYQFGLLPASPFHLLS